MPGMKTEVLPSRRDLPGREQVGHWANGSLRGVCPAYSSRYLSTYVGYSGYLGGRTMAPLCSVIGAITRNQGAPITVLARGKVQRPDLSH